MSAKNTFIYAYEVANIEYLHDMPWYYIHLKKQNHTNYM